MEQERNSSTTYFKMWLRSVCFTALYVAFLVPFSARADDNAAAAMAKALQDPLANLKGIMSDNTIAYDGGPDDDTSYSFQIQPVYSIPTEGSMNYIARAVIPIVGIEPGVVAPRLGPEPRPDTGSTWGFSDTILQLFIAPKTDSSFKWGIGPQLSLDTSSTDRLKGSGLGAGISGVLVAGSGSWSYSAILAQHWGENDFEVATIQPMIFYNVESIPGMAIGYNNSITYNWDGESGDKWNVPIGLMVGRTLALSNGDGLDLNIGAYKLVEKPENAPEYQIKFGISYLFN